MGPMKRFHDYRGLAAADRGAAVAMGNFDGVHLGHQSVLALVNADAGLARKVIAEMAGVWDGPIVTEVAPAQTWYKAEDYHQDYFRNHPLQGYCAFVVAPKVMKFRKTYAHRLK